MLHDQCSKAFFHYHLGDIVLHWVIHLFIFVLFCYLNRLLYFIFALQTEVNTFQAIIASNGTTSYAISMYQKGGMKWEFVPNRNIYVGHVSDKALKDYKLTFSRKTVSLGSDIGTAGKLSQFQSQVKHECMIII